MREKMKKEKEIGVPTAPEENKTQTCDHGYTTRKRTGKFHAELEKRKKLKRLHSSGGGKAH